jgi:hypothetical protein
MVPNQGEKLQVPQNASVLGGNPSVETITYFYCQ